MKTAKQEQTKNIIESLEELNQDSTVPKNIKIKIERIISILNEDVEIPIKINKVLYLLDEIADDTNIKSYTRTQIWNIVSLLEKI